jgi:hypothetical protein
MKESASFGVTDLAVLVGIQPIQLNKFIERKKYGIVQAGKGKGTNRRFNEEDVFGIALVWWLFESGLRSETIQFVLNQICGGRLNSKANDAAKLLLDGGAERLVVTREPRSAPAKQPRQQTQTQNVAQAAQIARETSTASVLIIPVGGLFARLQEAIAGNSQS